MSDLLLHSGLVLTVLVGAGMDIRSRRIPNLLSVGAIVLALSIRLVLGGGPLLDGVLGLLAASALVLPLFAMGGIGGGDAKLLMAAGAFLGVPGVLVALLATALAGGAMSFVYATQRGVILPALLNAKGLLQYIFTGGTAGERTTLSAQGALSIPYGVAIAAGSIFALWYGSV
jgi:prepilin peptidase CpaA